MDYLMKWVLQTLVDCFINNIHPNLMDVNMKLLSTIFAVSAITLASMSASAQLIPTDWKSTGDKLATLDESTGIEWLDLTQTVNMSIDTAENHLSGRFEGWRLPTRSEVTQLMVNAFPSQAAFVQGAGNLGVTNRTTDNEADNFRLLLGTTHSNSNGEYTHGIFKNDPGGQYSVLKSGAYDKRDNNYVSLSSNTNIINDTSWSASSYGVYLVSDGGTTQSSLNDPSLNANNANAPSSVPLPATAALLGLGLLGFGARRKKNG
ncbi:MAG: hypothetical protein ACI936_000049 [Paraglaciecola sp.]|jgi:hypothetical protein